MSAGPADLLESMIGRTSANTLVLNSELHFNRGNKGPGQKRLLCLCTQQMFTEASHTTTVDEALHHGAFEQSHVLWD